MSLEPWRVRRNRRPVDGARVAVAAMFAAPPSDRALAGWSPLSGCPMFDVADELADYVTLWPEPEPGMTEGR